MPQIVCRVCGTRQENAWDCAVCGRPLHERPRVAVAVEPPPGFEPTRLNEDANVGVGTLPDLVPTALDDGGEPLPERFDLLEPTSFAAAEAPVEALPDLEPTAFAEVEVPAAAQVVCRYCGTAWHEGQSIFCSRCGMRVGTRARRREEEAIVACRSCGARGQRPGRLCSHCLEPVPPAGSA